MDKNYTIIKPSPLMVILSYLVIFIVGASFMTMLIARIISNIYDTEYTELINFITEKNYLKLPLEAKKLSAITQGISNFLAYFVTVIFVILYSRDELKLDFLKLKNKTKFYALYTLIAVVAFMVITLSMEKILKNFQAESENQNLIVFILSYGGAAPMIIATVLIAPILEELVYRKAIFKIFKKYSVAAAYLFSILAFTLPHVITSDMSDFGNWLIITIPYLVSASLLALIYDKSNENIYVTITVHMINNLIAVILVYIKGGFYA